MAGLDRKLTLKKNNRGGEKVNQHRECRRGGRWQRRNALPESRDQWREIQVGRGDTLMKSLDGSTTLKEPRGKNGKGQRSVVKRGAS